MGKLLPEGRWAQVSCTQVVQTQTPALATPLILLSVFRSKVIPLGGCKIAFLFRIETVGILFPYLSFFFFWFFEAEFPWLSWNSLWGPGCPWTQICLPLPVLELKACATMPSPYIDFKNSCWCWLHYMGRNLASGSLRDPVGREHCDAVARGTAPANAGEWRQKTHSPAASPRFPVMARSIILKSLASRTMFILKKIWISVLLW